MDAVYSQIKMYSLECSRKDEKEWIHTLNKGEELLNYILKFSVVTILILLLISFHVCGDVSLVSWVGLDIIFV